MALPFLNSVYLPKGSSAVDPDALYKTILTYQAQSDRTAKLTIPADFASGANEGNFESGVFRDPMEEMPFEITATDIKEVAKLTFKSKYARPDAKQDVWNGAGIKASLEIEGGGGCGIASSSGSISLHPMWKKVDKDGNALELFEGTLMFKVKYGFMYSRKGHGSGQSETIDFWAVRAKK